MHKKLAADLTSLAHSILQMKNKEDVFALQKKAHELYEKLSVLAYVEEYINNTPNPEHTKEEFIEKIESIAEKTHKKEDIIDEVVEDAKEKIEEKKKTTLDEELQDTISVEVVADLFENAPKKSLNDQLQGNIQIGLNDRIAFVKNLFNDSQEDFNRVISQLNTFKTKREAKKFINKVVKSDYDWTEKEEFEERFIAIVERKFT